jgi:type IV pilus biogenesis protein CpaD/CtpE
MRLSRHHIRAHEESARIVNEIMQRVRASSKKCGRWWESYPCLLDDELDEPAALGNWVRDEEVVCHG